MRTRRSHSSNDLVQSPHTGTHQSVLLHEAIEILGIQSTDTVVDGTVGGGGHSRALAAHLGSDGMLIGFDLDSAALERGRESLAHFPCKQLWIQTNFRHIHETLLKHTITHIDKIILDLGWSSYQLADGRGLSFMNDEPLDMNYDREHSSILSARIIVNEWEEGSIADILYGWGEEQYSRRIARAIVYAREDNPIDTTHQLAEIIKHAVPTGYRFGRIHPATKTFQALRIAVNDEMGALEELFSTLPACMAPHGKVAIITFHSIEDRLVKRAFVAYEQDGCGERITKKPLVPTSAEIITNPRARSAKLRCFQFI